MSGYDPAGKPGVPGAPGAVVVSKVNGKVGDVVLTVADIAGAAAAADVAAGMAGEVVRSDLKYAAKTGPELASKVDTTTFTNAVVGGKQDKLQGALFTNAPVVSTLIDASIAQYGLTWAANPSITRWRGRLYAAFDANSVGTEGGAGQVVYLMTSVDGVAWTAPVPIFTNALYSSNPLVSVGVHFQPNLVVVNDQLWCLWNGGDNLSTYVSKLLDPAGKWTNARVEFDANNAPSLSATIDGAASAGHTLGIVRGGVTYVPFAASMATPLSDGTWAAPYTFQSNPAVQDPAATVTLAQNSFFASLKLNIIMYISADGATLTLSEPIPNGPKTWPAANWEPFVVEARNGDIYVFSRNDRLALPDNEAFLWAKSSNRLLFTAATPSGLEIPVTRGQAIRVGPSRWFMFHCDNPQQDTGTPTTFRSSGRLNPTVFVSRTGTDDFVSGPRFGDLTQNPLSYPQGFIDTDGTLWTIYTEDSTGRSLKLSKLVAPVSESTAYLHPGRRPIFLTYAGPAVLAGPPASLMFDGTSQVQSAAAYDPAGDFTVAFWHRPTPTQPQTVMFDTRGTFGGFVVRPAGINLGSINLDHGVALPGGTDSFVAVTVNRTTGKTRATVGVGGAAPVQVDKYLHVVSFPVNPADGDTVTVNGTVYTFRNTPVAGTDVLRHATNKSTTAGNFSAVLTAAGLSAPLVDSTPLGPRVYIALASGADFALAATGAPTIPGTLPIDTGSAAYIGAKAISSGLVAYTGRVYRVAAYNAALTDAQVADVYNVNAAALGFAPLGGAVAAPAAALVLDSTATDATWPGMSALHPGVDTTVDAGHPVMRIKGEAYASVELPFLKNSVEFVARIPAALGGTDQYVLASFGDNGNPVRLSVSADDPTHLKLDGVIVATVADTTQRMTLDVVIGNGLVTVNGVTSRKGVSTRMYLGNAFPQALLGTAKVTLFDLDSITVSNVRTGTSIDRAELAQPGGVATLDVVTGKVPDAQLGRALANGVASLGATSKVPDAQLGRALANGVASLDATGKVPQAQSMYPTFSGARLAKSAVQSILPNAPTAITFDTEDQDTDAYHDNAVNTTRITAPVTGVYIVGASAELLSLDAGCYIILRILRNGTRVDSVDMQSRVTTPTSQHIAVGLTRLIPMNAGQYVEMTVEHNSAAARDCRDSTAGTGFWIARVA